VLCERPARSLLKKAEKDLARHDSARARLEAELVKAASANDHAVLRRLGADLSAVQAEVAVAEERWLAVSEELDAR